MTDKGETYSIPIVGYPKEFQRLIMDLNRILSRMEDRLDSIEAIRGVGYNTTQRWEKDIVK